MKNKGLGIGILLFLGIAVAQAQPESAPGTGRPFAGIRDKLSNRIGGKKGVFGKGPLAAPVNANIDADGDGKVSDEEIFAVVSRAMKDIRDNEPKIYAKVLKRFDANGDGEINQEEALKIHAERQKRTSETGDQMGEGPQSFQRHPQPPVAASEGLTDGGLLDGVKIEGYSPPVKN